MRASYTLSHYTLSHYPRESELELIYSLANDVEIKMDWGSRGEAGPEIVWKMHVVHSSPEHQLIFEIALAHLVCNQN